MSTIRLTGGCQCGAVRYALNAPPDKPCICYCRMCQKQVGNVFGAFAGINIKDFELTRGEISYFRSSDEADRGFCAKCGTPLAYRHIGRPRIAVTIGSLDDPAAVKPVFQYGGEGRVDWLAEVLARPATETGFNEMPEWSERIVRTSRQHPDHDTAAWPPA